MMERESCKIIALENISNSSEKKDAIKNESNAMLDENCTILFNVLEAFKEIEYLLENYPLNNNEK